MSQGLSIDMGAIRSRQGSFLRAAGAQALQRLGAQLGFLCCLGLPLWRPQLGPTVRPGFCAALRPGLCTRDGLLLTLLPASSCLVSADPSSVEAPRAVWVMRMAMSAVSLTAAR